MTGRFGGVPADCFMMFLYFYIFCTCFCWFNECLVHPHVREGNCDHE